MKFKIQNSKFNILALMVFISLISIMSFPQQVSSQSVNDKYIWEYLYSDPAKITGADDLKAKLESEVQNIITVGHLAPFRTIYGEGPAYYFWYNPYDTIYTLSLAYPYVNSSLKDSIINYLATEMENYPIWYSKNPGAWGNPFLPADAGTKREPDMLTGITREINYYYYIPLPRLFGLYALWSYAQNTGDWNYINTNWQNIKSYYADSNNRTWGGQALPKEADSYYSSIAGAVGLARMARQKPSPDTAFANSVAADIDTGLTKGKNFFQFGQLAQNAFWAHVTDCCGSRDSEMYTGFVFQDISPEIGRYMADDASLKTAVTGSSSVWAAGMGESFYPLWYMAQAPCWSVYYGEGSGCAPDTKNWFFPIHAYVNKDPVSKLRLYLDAPDAVVGDYYYIQNLVRTIELSGQPCWKNLQTNTCSQ